VNMQAAESLRGDDSKNRTESIVRGEIVAVGKNRREGKRGKELK